MIRSGKTVKQAIEESFVEAEKALKAETDEKLVAFDGTSAFLAWFTHVTRWFKNNLSYLLSRNWKGPQSPVNDPPSGTLGLTSGFVRAKLTISRWQQASRMSRGESWFEILNLVRRLQLHMARSNYFLMVLNMQGKKPAPRRQFPRTVTKGGNLSSRRKMQVRTLSDWLTLYFLRPTDPCIFSYVSRVQNSCYCLDHSCTYLLENVHSLVNDLGAGVLCRISRLYWSFMNQSSKRISIN